ncbi:hypothetical protein [Pseudonocardia alni]|nr:hypothetical protein [Pseudonocardia alni]
MQERHARRSADEFLTAWRAGDATDNVGRPLVSNLLAFIPPSRVSS